MLCLTACSPGSDDSGSCDLNGKGIEEIMQVDIPDGYEQEPNVVRNEDGGELISIHYGKGEATIYIMIMSYKGKAVMGSDETMEEWYEDKEDIIAETAAIENADSDAFIYPIGMDTDESTTGEQSVIEAVFAYHDYLIMVGMENYDGAAITKEQKELFRGVLESIRFAD